MYCYSTHTHTALYVCETKDVVQSYITLTSVVIDKAHLIAIPSSVKMQHNGSDWLQLKAVLGLHMG